jgi:hypothetical protein
LDSSKTGRCGAISDHQSFSSLEPFLNPVQVRLLLALRDGPKTQGELAALLHRDVRVIRLHAAKLHRWGLVRSQLQPVRAQALVQPWPDTLHHLCNVIRSHLAGIESAVMDLLDAPPITAIQPPPDGRSDMLSYIREVRKRGP